MLAFAGGRTATEQPEEPVFWFQPLGDWCSELLAAVSEFINGDAGAGAIVQACADLGQIESDLAAIPKYRPGLAGWQAVTDMVGHCRNIADRYLRCLCAPTMEEAQQLGTEAQESIDMLGTRLAEWRELHDMWFGDDDTLPADVVARGVLIGARAVGAAADGLLDADTVGHDRYTAVTGETDCPSGLGLSLGMIEAHVAATMDEKRFWPATALAYRRLTGRQQRGRQAFAAVAAAPEWLPDMVEVQAQLVDAIREMPTDLDDAQTRLISRGLIRLGHLNCERAAKYLMATLLSAFRDRDYATQRKRDFGALLSDMRDQRLDSLLIGVDAALRHGDAHGEFTAHLDGVEFTCDRREYDFLTWDELVDRVLAGIESTLAMFTAAMCAAAREGLDGDEFVDLTDFFEPADCMALTLAIDGWTAPDITIDDGDIGPGLPGGVRRRRSR